MQIRDISTPLRLGDFPVWPGDATPQATLHSSFENGDEAQVTHLSLSMHTGTHLDAPVHFVPGGRVVSEMDLRDLMGPARVVHFDGNGPIRASFFADQNLPCPIRRLLIHCACHAGLLDGSDFCETYCGITPDAAEWLVARGLRLIGTDYLSIGPFGTDNGVVHRILLGASVVIVEGLDLRGVTPGDYTLICLPPAFPTDGVPCRAVLLPNGVLPDPHDAVPDA